jgi:hypothetical protein
LNYRIAGHAAVDRNGPRVELRIVELNHGLDVLHGVGQPDRFRLAGFDLGAQVGVQADQIRDRRMGGMGIEGAGHNAGRCKPP